MFYKIKYYIKNKNYNLFLILRKIRYPFYPVPNGLATINILFQRIFRINGDVPWMVNYTSRVVVPDKITIGKNVWISFAVSNGCYIQGGNGIIIGDYTIFGPGVKIVSANHDPQDLSKWIKTNPIIIGKKCWIAANAVILPGVKLGDNCVVGAGSVVTKSFPDNCIIAGVPGKLIGKIDEINDHNRGEAAVY